MIKPALSLLAVLALSSTGTVVATTTLASPAAAETTSRWIDDADPKAWTYAGAWTASNGEDWSAGNQNGSERFSNLSGSRATVQFAGTGFDLVGPTGLNGGQFRVTVDCEEQYTGSSFSAYKEYQKTLLAIDHLPSGLHTVVVEVLGTRDAGATDDFVILDGIRVHDAHPAIAADVRWTGGEGVAEEGEAITLRRPGCGAASDLLAQLRERTVGGWFGVPGGGPVWGAVNGHSVETAQGVRRGPIVVGTSLYQGATIPLVDQSLVYFDIELPDTPRTLALTVAADQLVGEEAGFAVVGGEGMVLPMMVMAGAAGQRDERSLSEAFTLPTGQLTTVVVDLRDEQGVGAEDGVTIVAWSANGAPSELVLLDGRTSDLSANRFARLYDADALKTDAGHAAVPFDFFQDGPVVLSRALADSDVPAWAGDRTAGPAQGSAAVPITFGETDGGDPLTVNGVAQPADSIGIRLPYGEGTTSVHLQLETGKQCRALTASVGIDDSTADRDQASVSLSFHGDGEALPMHHNGTWSNALDNVVSDFYGFADVRNPVIESEVRGDLTDDLHDALLAMAATAYSGDSQSLTALEALINTRTAELRASVENPSMDLMTYPVPSPLVLGNGANGRLNESEFTIGEFGPPGSGEIPRALEITPVDGSAAFPLSVDLASPRLMEALRWAARGTKVQLGQIESPLVHTVDIVVSGTPGAVVVLSGAGLDCESVQSGERAFPLWSQIGVRPWFLPTPTNTDGTTLDALVFNPMWWDTVCPTGPSTGQGLTFTAVRTRTTVYGDTGSGDPGSYESVKITETASAQRRACALPADQRAEDFGEYTLANGSDPAPTDPRFTQVSQHVADPVASQLLALDGSLGDRTFNWLDTALETTMEHPVEIAVWAVLAPFDLPAALVMNPFVMNALPFSVGVALGGAYLPAGLAAETEAAVAEGDLLLVGKGQHATELAAGERASLTLGDRVLSVPLRAGATEPTTELVSHTTTSRVIATDVVAAELPAVSDSAPWVDDELLEGKRTICPRGNGLGCTQVTVASEIDVSEEEYSVDEEDEPEVPTKPKPGVGPVIERNPAPTPVAGYWERYPGLAANLKAEVVPVNPDVPASWTSEAGAYAWAETARLLLPGAEGEALERLLPQANVALDESTFARVVVSTSTEPAYVFSTHPPDWVRVHGLRGNQAVQAAAIAGTAPEAFSVNLARSPSTIDDTIYIAATRDPDPYALNLPAADQPTGWWRYRIDRSHGGGIDLQATLAQPNLTTELHALSQDPTVVSHAPLLYTYLSPYKFDLAQKLEYVTSGAYDVVKSEWLFLEPGPVRADEVFGHSVPWQADRRAFDWYTPGATGNPHVYVVPELPNLEGISVPEGANLVWTKHSTQWGIHSPGVVTPEILVRDGFEAGTIGGSTRIVWIPKSRPGFYSVTPPPEWHPVSNEP